MIEVGKVYMLYAPWHTRHGKDVLVVMKREGVSEDYAGRDIYHIVADPYCTTVADLDTEFIEDNFRETGNWELIKSILDTPCYRESILHSEKNTRVALDDHNRVLYPVVYEDTWKGRASLSISYYVAKDGDYPDFGAGCMLLNHLANLLSFYNEDGTLKEFTDGTK